MQALLSVVSDFSSYPGSNLYKRDLWKSATYDIVVKQRTVAIIVPERCI